MSCVRNLEVLNESHIQSEVPWLYEQLFQNENK